METPKVYIETTLFNFYFAETRGQYYGKTVVYCRDARRFFAAVEAGEFEPYTSEAVIDELMETHNTGHRAEMMKLVEDFAITSLPVNERVRWLADRYIEAGAIPAKQRTDALHVASATVHGLDFIVSLNFKHIVKDKAILLTAMVNEDEGYDGIGIHEPGEITDDGRT